ncbi:MAG: tRNA lysidine(34) synthetase TilS [Lysinibacillus sp.]
MSFELKVQHYIEREQLILPGERLLVAVSGGVDSMALLQYLAKSKKRWSIDVQAVHVDHMLRGEASAEDREFVQQYCEAHHIPLHARAIPIPKMIAEEKGNSQLICRRERYRYFREVMQEHGLTKLVTAHHADDQLESVLMALTKNATINSMQGIPPMRIFEERTLIRPFLTVTKSEIREYLQKQGVCYREDLSNEKDDYLRNRFRHHIVPLLKIENPRVTEQTIHFTKQLQEDDALLMTLAQDIFAKTFQKTSGNMYSAEIEAFQMVPLALQRRLILILLNYLYKDSNTIQSYTLLTSLLKLCETTAGNAEIHLPEGYMAVRQYGKLIVQKSSSERIMNIAEESQILTAGERTILTNGMCLYIATLHELTDELLSDTAQFYYFNSSEVDLPLRVRKRKEGDRILLRGMDTPKRLSRLFIDEKIPLNERNSWPLLVSQDGKVVAVLGVRASIYLSSTVRPGDDLVLIVH